MAQRIIVIGGGIVGVCSALALQQSGHHVTLVDRAHPGAETSYGNAGVLCDASVVVLNSPDLIKTLPKLLVTKNNGLRYAPWFVLRRLGWFIKFLTYATAPRAAKAARALRDIQIVSLAQHKDWIKAAGVEDLLRYAGWLKVFRTKQAYAAFRYEADMMASVGAKTTVVAREELRQLEPGLKPIYHNGVLFDDTCSVSNPAKITAAYLALFRAAGGDVVCGNVTDVTGPNRSGSGTSGSGTSDSGKSDTGKSDTGKSDSGTSAGPPWVVTHSDGKTMTADQIVLAAGAWSREIASWLGYDIPMAWERGYHMHLAPGDGAPLNRAVHDVDGGFVMAPMQQGVRITTGVELDDRDAPKTRTQIDQSIELARMAHDMKAPVEDEPWMGRRPTLIDSLPMIGPAPRHAGLWFNFGHQHIGLSMAPGSGLALAAMISGDPAPFDATPFRADRFPI